LDPLPAGATWVGRQRKSLYFLHSSLGGFGGSIYLEEEGKKSQSFNQAFNQLLRGATLCIPVDTWGDREVKYEDI
jgi:hypothetical protein